MGGPSAENDSLELSGTQDGAGVRKPRREMKNGWMNARRAIVIVLIVIAVIVLLGLLFGLDSGSGGGGAGTGGTGGY